MTAASVAARATGNPGINNTAWLFFILALAFLFYVTIKGDLPKWLGLLGLGSKSAATTTPAGTASVGGGLPGLPAVPAIGQPAGGQISTNQPAGGQISTNQPIYDLYGKQIGFGSPAYAQYATNSQGTGIDTSTFGGMGYTIDPYAGPLFSDITSGF